MSYATEQIAETLRKARAQKGLSQRALSARAGVPQSHISKIENNAVDLRISSLTAIAHALDLELALVPRKAVPAVKSVTRSVGGPLAVAPDVSKEFRRIENILKAINAQADGSGEMDRLRRRLREISQYANLVKEPELVRNIRKSLESAKVIGDSDAMKRAADQMNALRNNLAHAQATSDNERPARAAYRLDGGDDG